MWANWVRTVRCRYLSCIFLSCIALMWSVVVRNITVSYAEVEPLRNVDFVSPEWEFRIDDFFESNQDRKDDPTIEYFIHFINVGSDSATNTIIVANMDSLAEYFGCSDGGVYDSVSHTVTWSLGTVSSRQVSHVSSIVELEKDIPHETKILFSASISCDENIQADDSIITTVAFIPDLVVSQETEIEFDYPDRIIVYAIEYGNLSNAPARDVVLRDYLPEGAEFVSCTRGCEIDSSEREVIWHLGVLQSNMRFHLPHAWLRVRVDPAFKGTGTILNEACLSCEKITQEICSRERNTIMSPPDFDLSIKSRDKYVQAGEDLVYWIQCENIGWTTASSVVFVDSIPQYTEYIKCSGGGIYDPISKTVKWEVETIERGESLEFYLTVRVIFPLDNRTPIINTMLAECYEGVTTVASATTTVLSSPTWTISMDACEQKAIIGTPVTFTSRLRNTGNMNATETIIRNSIPKNVICLGNTGGGTLHVERNAVIWDIGRMEVDTERIISVTLLAGPEFSEQNMLVNYISVHSAESDDSISFSVPIQFPRSFDLSQNYPNPFNSETVINYQLLTGSSQTTLHTTLKILNLLGQEVRTLVDDAKKSGDYSVTWDGRNNRGREVPSGIYFYLLSVDGGHWSETKRMVLLR